MEHGLPDRRAPLVRQRDRHDRRRHARRRLPGRAHSVVNKYAKAKGLLKEKDENLAGEDIREGLTAIISVRLREPQFEGQTKAKLGNPPIKTMVQRATNDRLGDWLEEHPTEANKLVKKAIAAQRARAAAKQARDATRRKSALDGAGMPDKLKDCSSRNRDECELFIVEGDSAGGSAIKARDPRTQAILPIRGKILNVDGPGWIGCSPTTRSRR